ncbi:hypothetical protein D3C77_585660 [compost metagenome]
MPWVRSRVCSAARIRFSWPSVLNRTVSFCACPDRFETSSAKVVLSPPARKRGADNSAIKGAATTVLPSATP